MPQESLLFIIIVVLFNNVSGVPYNTKSDLTISIQFDYHSSKTEKRSEESLLDLLVPA